MSGVIVEQGCQIVNSIIGTNAVIKKNMILNNCVIGDDM